ncbi:NADH dehydrogenase [ubiquinone] 1 alpha subcomplex subunit 5 [Apis cerana]|uniref:NADH dehydrogenase [ubiquinone] 1 alpha subcomplex subunit n=2 Tax=Apis cerana TaxID=7461 RepID=A0A2A3EAH4_APICC|nr:NADH dehydrogenase [ubiquinone] 1 alpha subcomplex subunit 5 [Apis cerana]PBC28209.1 NADH dehydrogenase [ubiquinone] 1 alpha subcomplex subunit [Apis cerana cerana]
MSNILKKTTGLTGLAVSSNPRLELSVLYDRILRLSTHLPKEYIYRKSVENLAKERINIVKENENVAVIEEKINQGQVEELINHAKNEIFLIQEIIEQRPWENLLEKAPPHQWTWPAYK